MKTETLIKRRHLTLQAMHTGSMAVLFAGDKVRSSADANYPFLVNRNFFYLTGLEEDGLILVLMATASGKKEILFIKDFNPFDEKWIGRSLRKEEATRISGIINIHPLSQFEAFLTRNLNTNDIKTLYIDSERLNLKQRNNEAESFSKQMKEKYPGLAFVNLNSTINAQRRIKDGEEIEAIKAAIETTRRGLERVAKELKPGRMEYQVAADFAYQLGLEHSTNSFDTIAVSGADATILHYVDNNKELKNGEMILLDLGATHGNYCADISRTYPINGKFTQRQKELYSIVLKAQEAVIEAIKPGISLMELNEIVKSIYREDCVKAGVIETPEQIDEIYYHGVSHYLGLDTHDVGQLEGTVLQPGMVITVEPGLYCTQEGIGIRIEDDVLVTNDGHENLSVSIPKTIDAIEQLLSPS